MARVDVIMPQMGESIAEGTVSKWLKQVGDAVKRDEAILEISTDKVDAEIPSPASGVLVEIKVPQGTTVEIQTVVAVIETEAGAAVATPAPSKAPAPAAAAAPKPAAPAAPSRPAPQPAMAPAAQLAPTGDGGGVETADERLRRKSTPLVRRIAAEHAVDIGTIPGTGHAGRVTKQDILSFIERAPAAVAPAARMPASPASPAGAGAVQHPAVEPWPGDRVEPMSKIRKLTADHMIMSRRVSAHVTSFYEVDFSHIAKLRQAKKKEFEAAGAKLTYMGFITKSIANNLRRHPVVNASVSGDTIIYRQAINIGMAVALD
ncbi:MAG TPA: 2-oxo acid dehydrogenase subunit E2, partial [Gemmatimonadales bacterium]